MQKVILLIAAILSVATVNAQNYNWSAGLRLGARYDNLDYYNYEAAKLNPEISLFIKRKVYHRFSAEISLSYFQVNKSFENTLYNPITNQSTNDGTYQFNQSILFSTVGINYSVIAKQKVQVYFSGGITNRHVYYKQELRNNTQPSFSWFGEDQGQKHAFANTLYMGAGSNYNINKELLLNINARIETLSNQLFNSGSGVYVSTPLFMPTLQIGIAYKF